MNSFYSELSIKISSRKEKHKQAIKEIKAKLKSGKEPKGTGELLQNPLLIRNPVYLSSDGENSFDVKRKLIGPNSSKSLLNQTQEWHSPNFAALNRAGNSSRSDRAPTDHRPRGIRCETTLYHSKAKKWYTEAASEYYS